MKHKFPFCPNCQSPNNAFLNNHRYQCNDCDFAFYKNVAASVAVLLIQEDKILFTVRNQEPMKGKLDLPGGFVDPKESGEQTCSRELLEELNLHIPQTSFLYLASQPNDYWYKNQLYHTLDLFYKAEFPSNQKLMLEKQEIQEVCWIKLSEIPLEKIGFDSMKQFFKGKNRFFGCVSLRSE